MNLYESKRAGRIAMGCSGVLLAALSLSIITACGQEKKAQAVSIPPAPVTVAKAEVKDVPMTISAVGNITPFSTVQVKSMVTAPVVSINFKPGDFVKKGQLIFQLDESSFKADLSRLQGQLAKDQAAAALAKQQAARYAELYKQGVSAREMNDTMQATADQAEAVLIADKAAIETSRINLRYCRILSPIDGRAGDVLVYPGNLIKANDANLVVINQIVPIYVDFSVPEQNLPNIKKHMASGQLKVQAVFPDATQAVADGKLSFVDNAVDPKTGTIALKATFQNTDHRLWPGQFVNTVVTLATISNAVIIPIQAVQNGQKGPFVYVVTADNKAALRQVQLGAQLQNMQVVLSGVNPGDSVVTDGQLRVVPNGALDIKPSAPTSATGSSTGSAGASAPAAR